MSYIDQSRSPSPASMMAVIGVHAAMAAALVAGLTVSGIIPPPHIDVDTFDVPVPPPPTPDPTVEPKDEAPALPDVFVPQPKLPLDHVEPKIPTSDITPSPFPTPQPGKFDIETPKITPGLSFDPVSAKPRNDPSRWLSDRDYRPNWARQELTGTARFRLEIAADGRVEGCRITGSTGHSSLDEATCALVTRRARFEPARGVQGEPVRGVYNGAVVWQLPAN